MTPHLPPRPVAFLAVLFLASLAPAQIRQRVVERRQGEQTLRGIEALRALHKSGKPADAERYGFSLIWADIRNPEALYLLASTQDRLKKRTEAAAFYALFLRTLEDAGGDAFPDAEKYRRVAAQRLKGDKQDKPTLSAAYAKTAAGKKFAAPGQVDDAWMNNVKGDLLGLHALYAWKLVGGRKDAKPDWVHNTQGTMHRSGLKRMDDVEGRKGVLFTAVEKSAPNHVEARNVGGCKFLRAGLRGYGFPVVVKVTVDGQEVATEVVSEKEWSDLKIELPPAAPRNAAEPAPAPRVTAGAKKPALFDNESGQKVVLELTVPEGQQWSEGIWIDYLDFFDD